MSLYIGSSKVTGIQKVAGASQWGEITGTLSDQTDLQEALNAKQDDLISGTNIKTINGNSILGEGNIEVAGSVTVDQTFNPSSTYAQSGTAVAGAVSGKQDTLISGTNIKTINGNSVLGSGDITISGGGTATCAWGSITGLISNQTDLQVVLNNKANSSTVTALQDAVNGKEDVLKTVNVLATSGTITLTDNSINSISPSSTVTFKLPTISDNTKFHQILVQVNMATVRTINVGTTYYFNRVTPNMSTVGVYNLYYEYDKAKSYWVCGVLSKGAVS